MMVLDWFILIDSSLFKSIVMLVISERDTLELKPAVKSALFIFDLIYF